MAGLRCPLKMGVCVLLCIVLVQCAPTTESMTGVSPSSDTVVTGKLSADGICHCMVNYPTVVTCTDYEVRSTAKKLVEIREQVEKLTLEVNRLNGSATLHSQLITDFRTKLAEVTTTFDLIGGGQVLVTRGEIEGMRTRIQSMTSTLRALRQWYGVESETDHLGRIRSIVYETGNISQIVDEIASQDTIGDLAAIQREITALTNQLQTCNARASGDTSADAARSPSTVATPLAVPTTVVSVGNNEQGGAGDDHVPELWPAKKKQDSCQRLLKISEPYTLHGNLPVNGTWTRDPVVNPQFVYYHSFPPPPSSSSYDQIDPLETPFLASSSIKAFQKSLSTSLSGVPDHTLESVVYNGSIFAYSAASTRDKYNRYISSSQRHYANKKLSKIMLSHGSGSTPVVSGSDVTQRSIQTANLDRYPYMTPVSVPNLDLTVDESGIWLLYGNSLGMLTAAKLDQDTLTLDQTWEGSFPKNRLGNCFVICRRVYCVNRYTTFDSRVSYYMDTTTGLEGFTNIPFIVKYGMLASLEYNPRDQLLYGWDNGHAVVYSLTFEEG